MQLAYPKPSCLGYQLQLSDGQKHRLTSLPTGMSADLTEDCCTLPKSLSFSETDLRVVTWNIAAPNNNPFEYWAMKPSSGLDEVVAGFQQCMDHPESYDIKISDIFTPSMYQELRDEMIQCEIPGCEQMDYPWMKEMLDLKMISGFLKDKSFGEKRLISMPDRFTSVVCTEKSKTQFRPSPISGFQGEMGTVDIWWPLWKSFMFRTPVLAEGKQYASVASLLEPIPRAKYPSLSAQEEKASLPLQALCLALFDATLTHLLTRLAPDTWQPVRQALCRAQFQDKAAAGAAILRACYADADVIFVQEAGSDFTAVALAALPNHCALIPAGAVGRRPQLSLILVRRSAFACPGAVDLAPSVAARLPPHAVQPGDLCAFALRGRGERPPCVLASFHGDSDGRSTAPVLAALCAVAAEQFPGHALLVGLDANCPATPAPSPAPGILPPPPCMAAVLAGLGLASCWDGHGDPAGLWTAFRARTPLQPQLHKAVGPTEARGRRNLRLRDWIVFRGAGLALHSVARDNTGRGVLLHPAATGEGGGGDAAAAAAAEAAAAAAFPSDHVIVFATLRCCRGAGRACELQPSACG